MKLGTTTSSLAEWAVRWNIPQAAFDALIQTALPQAEAYLTSITPKSEDAVKTEVRLEAARLGIYLFRNNVGAGKLESGNFVRFGLANDSAQLNAKFKSADLIGLRRRLITQADVGTYIGQFCSREIKSTKWKFQGTAEHLAQVAWATLINGQGGDAKIVNATGSF